jgi:hypothetical protein
VNDLVPADATPGQIERANAVLAKLNEWLGDIPTSGEDGLLAILEQIVAADDPEAIDAAWNTAGFGEWLGYALRISNPRKAASKLAGGLGWFLIVDAVVHSTGEKITLTTSSTAIMAQILLAEAKGFLPMDFTPLEKEEPTENGFYPQHLKVWKNHMPVAPEPTAQMRRQAQRAQVGPEATARIRENIKASRQQPAPAPSFDVPETPEF